MSRPSSETTVDCVCCVETIGKDEGSEIDGVVVCHSCTRKMFDQALKHEHAYSVKFGPIRLEPDQFKHVLGEDFVKQFRKREEEYQIDIKDRVYCPHKVAAPDGSRMAVCSALLSGRARRSEVKTKLTCHSCGNVVCSHCKDTADGPRHDCTVTGAQIALELQADGLKRGKDFSTCPKCERNYERTEGCAEMHCPNCGQHWCHTCNEATVPRSNHWTRGGCPGFDGGPNGPQYDDDQVQHDDDGDFEGDPAIFTELIEGGLVQGLAAAILRRAILNGRLDDDEDEPWIRQRIFWFFNRYAPDSPTDDWMAIDRAIRSYIRETSHSVREVGLLWREMGRNAPAPLTEIQQVVVQILENMDIDQFGTGDHHAHEGAHKILGFVQRHRQIEEAIISYDLEHGLHRMHRDYPLVMTHWSYYTDRIPEVNRIAWASELGRLQMDFDAFNRAQGLEILEFRAQGTLGNHITRIRAQSSFANLIHTSIGEIRRLQRALPLLRYLRNFISRDIDTELWFRRHQELIGLFRQFEEENWSQTLPRHYVQWQEYLARLPAGLHDHLAISMQ